MKSKKQRAIEGVTTADVSRFLSKVDRTGTCWEWLGPKNNGYGAFILTVSVGEYVTVTASRMAYFLANEHLPFDAMVCHRCDNPGCVNPNHLFLGVGDDNHRDMTAKGRIAKGSVNGNAVLTDEMVIEMRRLFASGDHTKRGLARSFGVSQCCARGVLENTTWRHLL